MGISGLEVVLKFHQRKILERKKEGIDKEEPDQDTGLGEDRGRKARESNVTGARAGEEVKEGRSKALKTEKRQLG